METKKAKNRVNSEKRWKLSFLLANKRWMLICVICLFSITPKKFLVWSSLLSNWWITVNLNFEFFRRFFFMKSKKSIDNVVFSWNQIKNMFQSHLVLHYFFHQVFPPKKVFCVFPPFCVLFSFTINWRKWQNCITKFCCLRKG